MHGVGSYWWPDGRSYEGTSRRPAPCLSIQFRPRFFTLTELSTLVLLHLKCCRQFILITFVCSVHSLDNVSFQEEQEQN